jgi:hypothetical protein
MVPLTDFKLPCLASVWHNKRRVSGRKATQDSSGDAPSDRFHRGMTVFVQMVYGRTLLERMDGELRSLCCIGDGLGGDCMNTRFDITFPGDDKLEPIHMYNDFCQLFRNPIKWRFTCSCDDSDMVLLSPSGIELPPGTGEGHSSHSASILGRLWKDWDYSYEPTTGNDAIKGRYPRKQGKPQHVSRRPPRWPRGTLLADMPPRISSSCPAMMWSRKWAW